MSSTDIMLAPGEKGLYSRTMRPNFVLFWLKTHLVVTNKRIAVKAPNTLFGVIPLGFEERSMPIGSVAGVTASVKVFAGRLVFFGIIALLALIGVAEADGGGAKFGCFLLFVIFGILALNAIVASLNVTNNGGGVNPVSVSVLDKAALEDFKNKANEIIYSASAGGQSWNDAYGAGTDNFQNMHQSGPGQSNFGGAPQGYYEHAPQQWQQPEAPQHSRPQAQSEPAPETPSQPQQRHSRSHAPTNGDKDNRWTAR